MGNKNTRLWRQPSGQANHQKETRQEGDYGRGKAEKCYSRPKLGLGQSRRLVVTHLQSMSEG